MRSQATLEMVVDSRSTDRSRETAPSNVPAQPLAQPEVYRAAGRPTTHRGFFVRLIVGVWGYLHRRTVIDQFRWNVSAQQLGDVRPETVYCVDLPVSDPVGMLTSYMQSGVKADHVVFVGDPLTMTDDAYNRITQQGALVYETKKRSPHQQTQQKLAPRFVPAPVVVRSTATSNRYSYDPGAPAATPEQVQALIDAIAEK